jgi:hypothetical protein
MDKQQTFSVETGDYTSGRAEKHEGRTAKKKSTTSSQGIL